MMPWDNPALVTWTPVVTVALLEGGNLAQIVRMVRTRTARGQSVLGYTLVIVALAAWYNFYRVCTPTQVWALRATLVGLVANLAVLGTVLCYRRQDRHRGERA